MPKKAKKKEESSSSSSDDSSSEDSSAASDSSSADSSSDDSSSDSSSEDKKKKKKPTTKKKKPAKKKKEVAKKGTKRKRKDPNEPKRTRTAYMYFMQEQRPEFKLKNPGQSFAEQNKQLSERWKLLTEEDKKTYTKLHDEDKLRYEKELASYTPPAKESDSDSSSDEDKKRKVKKLKKDPNAPKRPANAYMFYQAEVRDAVKKEHTTKKVTEIAKLIGGKWRGLSAEEKKPYEDKAKLDKERYLTEQKEYESSKKV